MSRLNLFPKGLINAQMRGGAIAILAGIHEEFAEEVLVAGVVVVVTAGAAGRASTSGGT